MNYAKEDRIRVDLSFGLNHASSSANAYAVLTEVMLADEHVVQDPAPTVTIDKLNIEGMELAVRPRCAPEHCWSVYFGVYEKGVLSLQAAGLSGPQPSIRVLTEK